MNKLSFEDRAKVVRLLVEGNSMMSCSRIMDISFNTVRNILIEVGKACTKFHNDNVVNIPSKRVQCDEIWAYILCKDKNVDYCTKKDDQYVGDAWTWVGMDADTKLVISWLVGNRGATNANAFMRDIAGRLTNKVQLTTDGYKPYLKAVENAFDNDIDFAQLIKIYGTPEGDGNERRYSPPTVTGIEKRVICGRPDDKDISTSYIERQNLTMRMQMRRFTRLTNAFSKKIEHHNYAVAINYAYYNWVRIHKTLRVTPAMEAKLIDHPMTLLDIVHMAYADEIAADKKRLARMYR